MEIGGSLEIHCIGTGFPIQLLTWEIDGNVIEHSPPNIEIMEILRINPGKYLNVRAYYYSIKISIQIHTTLDMTDGYTTESAQVTVSISIHNIQNPINKLTCVGTNLLGLRENSTSVVLLAPPCTPESVNVREFGETWAVIEWTNGITCFAGIQNVIQFTLNLTELSGQEIALITSSANTQLTSYRYNLSSLASDSFYKVRD